MKFKRGQFSIGLVCVIFGIMLVVQFRTTSEIDPSFHSQRVEDLTQRLIQAERDRYALLAQLQELRYNSSTEATAKENERIRMAAGVVPVSGPGLIVTLDDTSVQKASNKPSIYQIRSEDILKILNELKAAGAEAIAINEQRLVSTTKIRDGGSEIYIDNAPHQSPLRIQAIGDPITLENSLKMRGGVLESIQVWGIRITAAKAEKVDIPAYKGIFRFEISSPITPET